MTTIRRFAFIAAIAFWLGGFTFYTSVVVPVGSEVLGSHLRQGFITQHVTNWMNVAGTAALPVLAWNMAAIWSSRGRVARVLLVATVLVIAAAQAELFVLHHMLDRLVDVAARRIIDADRFDSLHLLYLWVATAQWAAGLLHVLCVVAVGNEPKRTERSDCINYTKMF